MPRTSAAQAASTGRGVGKERIARGRVQAEVVFDTAEPPHGIGMRPEVVRGEQVGLNRIEM